MGSKTFEGVRFAAYVNDHLPPHVHGFYGQTQVILDLDFKTRGVTLSKRRKPKPLDARRSDIRKIAKAARKYVEEVIAIWEEAQ